MPDRDFRTAAEARAAERADRVAAAERVLERIKRAVEAALDAYPKGSRERGETLKYCGRIGLEVLESPGAGLEFQARDLEWVGERIEAEPMPASLKRFAG